MSKKGFLIASAIAATTILLTGCPLKKPMPVAQPNYQTETGPYQTGPSPKLGAAYHSKSCQHCVRCKRTHM